MIFQETDFLTRYVKRKRSINKKLLNEMMITAVFTGDSSVVKLFIDSGLNKNAMFNKCSALAWAEGLGYDDSVRVLQKVKATTRYHPRRIYSMVFCVIDQRSNEMGRNFNLLPILHRLCEQGHSIDCDNVMRSPLAVAWERNQNHFVKYLLFRGANPDNIIPMLRSSESGFEPMFSIFVYHLIRTNQMVSVFKMLKLYEIMYEPDMNYISLEIINEISHPEVNLPREQFTIHHIDITRWPDSLFKEMLEWCSKPRPLTCICRRVLRRHYKGPLFSRFLRSVKHMVPKATYNFLQLHDIYRDSLISINVRIAYPDMDEQTAEVDQYFL